MSENSHKCSKCGVIFPSKKKLLKHLKDDNLCKNPDNFFPLKPIKTLKDILEDNDAYIYVTGGRFRGKTLCTSERYNVRDQIWEDLPLLNEHRGSHCTSTVGSYVYTMAGGGLRSNLNSMERIHVPNGEEWEYLSMNTSTYLYVKENENEVKEEANEEIKEDAKEEAKEEAKVEEPELSPPMKRRREHVVVHREPNNYNMATFRHALTSASDNERYIYVAGGWMYGNLGSEELERFDTIENKWETLTPMPFPRRLLGSTFHNGKFYVFGGVVGENHVVDTDKCTIYDPATNSWKVGKDLPTPGQCSACSIGGRLFVFIQDRGIVEYKPEEDKYDWITTTFPQRGWFCYDICVIGEQIFVYGGNVRGVWSSSVYSFTPFEQNKEEGGMGVWHSLPSMKRERRRCAGTAVVIKKK